MIYTRTEIDNVVTSDLGIHTEMTEAMKRYEGEFPLPLKPFTCPSDLKGADNYIHNLSRVVVDVAAHFLFGKSVATDITSEQGVAAAEETAYLQEIWDANDKDQFLIDLATQGAVCGHVFVRIHPNYYGDLPYFEILDSSHVSVYRDPLNQKKVRAYIITAYAKNMADGNLAQYQETIEYNPAADNWLITRTVGNTLQTMRVTDETVWPYSWPPIIDCKNLPSLNHYFGMADLSRDVIRANEALNFALSNTNRIIRIQGHQKVFVTGISPQAAVQKDARGNPQPVITLSPDTIGFLESSEAKVFSIAPGADINALVAYITELTNKFYDVSQVPGIAMGKIDPSLDISGIALKIAYTTLLNKNNTKRNLYGALLKQLTKRTLLLSGFSGHEKVTLIWPEVMPQNEVDKMTAAKLKKELGVPAATVLSELGYDAEPSE